MSQKVVETDDSNKQEEVRPCSSSSVPFKDVRKKKRRKRGTRVSTCVGPRRKKHRREKDTALASDASCSRLEVTEQAETSIQEQYVVNASHEMSEAGLVSEDGKDDEVYPDCNQSVNSVHLCTYSDVFSETATEFYSDSDGEDAKETAPSISSLDSDEEVKNAADNTPNSQLSKSGKFSFGKRRRGHLAYQRKGDSRKRKRETKIVKEKLENASTDDEGGDVDIEDIHSDLNYLSDLSLSDIDGELCELEEDDFDICSSNLSAADNDNCGHRTHEGLYLNVSEKQDISAADNTFFKSLIEKVQLLLPEDWVVLHKGQLLRLVKLNEDSNASVLRSISFEKNDNFSISIFIHGKPAPKSHSVFHCNPSIDIGNIGSLADYLGELTGKVDLVKVCTGISSFRDQWDFKNGWIDSVLVDEICFRSLDCFLVIDGNRNLCLACRTMINKFEREEKRRRKESDDPSSCPDKSLSKEAIKIKKDKFRRLYRSEKQRADRLQRSVDSLKIKLDAALKDELSALLTANVHKMTGVQKLFWKAQAKALAVDDKRGLRWHPLLIRLALHLHSLSDGAYEFLRDSKILTLPSKRRLYDYAHFVESKEGCQAEFTQHIKDKAEKCGSEDYFSYINLMFDEMSIRAGLVVNRSTGELVGYTKLDGVEEELKQMQSEIESKTYKPMLAKKVLVYLAQGISSDVKDVVAVYSTDDLSAGQLYNHTWEVVYHLEDAGVKVLTITCDGASVNRKFIFMHEPLDSSSAYTNCTKNLASGTGRPLFFVIDPPHLLKTIRNALANSYSHKKTRKLWKSGEDLSWKVIENVYELTKHQKFADHKLTKAHVKLSSFSCMTVCYATQVFSNSVARTIESLSSHKSMEMYDTRELVTFIKIMNRFFDCVNGKEKGEKEETNSDKIAFTDLNDNRFYFLQTELLGYFEDWKKDIVSRPGTFSDTLRNKMIISHQALGALQITVSSVVGAIKYMLQEAKAPAVSARIFNQDPLEQYFGKVRRMQGDNRNPFLKGFLDTRLNLHAQGLVSTAVQKGNTEGEEQRGWDIDSSPLPSRKISKKS